MPNTTNKDHLSGMTTAQLRLLVKLRNRSRAYCPKCERPVQLIPDAKAEEIFKSALPELLSLASRGVLHRLHNSHGILMFCGDSLFQCFNDRPTQLLTGANTPKVHEAANKKGL